MSGRPVESWATIGARLAAVASTNPPPWVSPATAAAVRAAVAGLRADLRRAAEGLSRREAAREWMRRRRAARATRKGAAEGGDGGEAPEGPGHA